MQEQKLLLESKIARSMRLGIVVSAWNARITDSLYSAALSTLRKAGVKEKNIQSITVPGSFELILGAQKLALNKKNDAVICLGCVIKGETDRKSVV